MRKFPESVNVLGRIYKIIYVDNPCNADIQGRTALWGQVDYWTRTIRVYNKDMTPEAIFEILLHETIHAIVNDLRIDFEENKSEDIIELLSLGISDMLLRNEWVKLEKDDSSSLK